MAQIEYSKLRFQDGKLSKKFEEFVNKYNFVIHSTPFAERVILSPPNNKPTFAMFPQQVLAINNAGDYIVTDMAVIEFFHPDSIKYTCNTPCENCTCNTSENTG